MFLGNKIIVWVLSRTQRHIFQLLLLNLLILFGENKKSHHHRLTWSLKPPGGLEGCDHCFGENRGTDCFFTTYMHRTEKPG